MDIWVVLSIVLQFALYTGALFASGMVFYTVFFEINEARLHFSAQRGIGLFVCIGIVASLARYCLQAANLTGELASIIDFEMLGILWETPAGTAFILRIVGLALVLMGLFLGTLRKAVTLIGSIMVLISFTQIGHVVGISDNISQAVLLIHLIGIALWVGILLPLYQLSLDTKQMALVRDIAQKFGKTALVFVPILIIAGGWLALALVGSFANIFFTNYGQVLLAKIVLVVALLGLAAVNKLCLVPALNAGDIQAFKHLNWSVRFEIVLAVLILVVTALLTGVFSLPFI